MLQGKFALGFWRLCDANISLNELENLINVALDNGISVMDHADIYGEYRCEARFGEVLKSQPSLRDKMYLVSKCGIKFKCDFTPNNLVKHYDLSADSIITSVNNSLANLGCDYLDLLLVHRPSPLMNVDEIAETFYQLQREGKVKQFGVSNFTPSQFDLLNSRIPLLTNQIEFSVLANQALFDGSLDQLQQYKLRPMAWSPLAGGKIFNSDKPQLTQLLQELADKYAVSVEQIALAWILRHPSNIQIVLGTQKSSRLINTLAAQHIELDIQDWFAILETVNGYPVA